MAIVYDPSKMLRKIAPKGKIEKLMKSNLSLKKTALSFVSDIDFLDKASIVDTVLKVIKNYKEREAKAVVDADYDKSAGKEFRDETLDDPKLLIQRVQNEVVWQVKEAIKTSYDGEEYEWLPSDADEPDPEHQLNYGKIFVVGDGEMPGDRDGCKCGMRILVKETQLELE